MRAERRDRPFRLAPLVAMLCLTPLWSVRAQRVDTLTHAVAHGMGWGRATFVLTEVFEVNAAAAERPVLFDVVGWTGGASRRLWFKVDGSAATAGRAMHGEYQALYGAMLSPWWDLQVGARADLRSSKTRTASRAGAVLGVQGLAPGWFEFEPSLFVTTQGNLSMDLTVSYDLFLTQRLVLQPRLESTVALRDEADFGIGRGLSSTSFGLRTRFEIRREFAPYLGAVWERGYGRSAELARLAGDQTGQRFVVAGLRLWY